MAVLALLGAGGYGWARRSGFDVAAAASLSPAFGLGGLTLVAIALERVGLPLSGSVGPTIVVLVSVAGGDVAKPAAQRRTPAEPATNGPYKGRGRADDHPRRPERPRAGTAARTHP